MDRLQNFIGGQYRDSLGETSLDVVDPSTGAPYLLAPSSTAADVDDACRAAAEAFTTWKRTTPAERSMAIFRFADALEARAEEFVAAECRNTGKPARWMREEEFPQVLDHLRYMATIARNLTGLASASYLTGYDSAVRREPVGVCGQVAPWNYPLLMAVWKFGPALAAGNTVVLKPSDSTPVTTSMLGSIAAEVLPPGVFNVVVGDRDTGRALVEHPIPALISVTGSVRAGMEVSASAAADLKRVHLELGGKAPVVVFGDVDLDARRRRRRGRRADQRRAGLRRGLPGAGAREHPRRVRGAAGRAGEGQDLRPAARGRRPRPAQQRRPARAGAGLPGAGAGPRRRPLRRCRGPSRRRLLRAADRHHRAAPGRRAHPERDLRPGVTVQSFGSEAEAVRLANDVNYGLAASVWTKDYETALRVSADLDFGQVWVNCHLIQPAELPNGGYKHSGHGNDLSFFALDDYTRVKQVTSALPR